MPPSIIRDKKAVTPITSQLMDKTIAKFGGKPMAVSDIGIMPDWINKPWNIKEIEATKMPLFKAMDVRFSFFKTPFNMSIV